MKSIKKWCSFLLVVSLCISMNVFPLYPVSAIEIPTENKITEELQARLDEMYEDDVISVYVWINDIDYERIEHQTFQKTGFYEQNLLQRSSEIFKPLDDGSISNVIEENLPIEELAKIVVEQSKDESNLNLEPNLKEFEALAEFFENTREVRAALSKDIDTYIDAKRGFARDAYNMQNGNFISESLKESEIFFQSQYAPMIICATTKAEILNLNKNKQVESISLYIDFESEDEGNLNISLPAIDADITRNTPPCFNGYGVKVGQIESGRPETGISNLSSTSITRGGTNNNTAHASLVATIIAGSNGIAPNASLYCTTADNYYANAEWLVSQNVTVINQSNGTDNSGQYGDQAQWVDHIGNQHNISFVKSAGNGGASGYITSPGSAYNVITVGGIDDRGTLSKSDDSYYTSTSCLSRSGLPNKPDVVAPAVGFSVTGGSTMSGTSFAAPHVTGMIAQMMECAPGLKLRPDAIKAAVMASCNRKTTGDSLTSLTSREGAGVVNAVNAVNSISNVAAQSTYYTTTGSSISFDFYPLTTGTKTIVISWLKRNTGTGTNHSTITSPALTDFDLRVYNSSGILVASSSSSYNSAEFIRFNATTTSKYTVQIVRYTSNTTSERISLAHVR